MTRFLIMLALCASLSAQVAAPQATASSDQSVNPVVQWNKNLLVIVRTPGAQPTTIHPTRSFALMPRPSCLGKTKIGGIDINKPRTRIVLNAVLALACAPRGFTVGEFAASVQ